MATNFFERQSKARRNTVWLIAMFLVAAVGIVASTFAVATLAVSQSRQQANAFAGQSAPFPWEVPMLAGGAALALVLGGTLFKVFELRAGGGVSVAERLGGKRLYPDNPGRAERRLLNVVEEMAIASGTPAPPVFLLEEQGINAFAAGYSPSDAVLGVTRGAIENLSRDELQGVIAHEFSHVLNGDMRMSIRLIGILHGILLLGLLGRMILRSAAYSGGGSSRNKGGGILALFAAALALIIIGFVGSFVGGLIKAAVSRQREFLADASAVQFTRNPDGIAGALKQIGASIAGSKLNAPGAAEASHMFFAKGVWEGFSGLMATHPPLTKRIRAILPQWDGKFPTVAPRAASPSADSAVAAFAGNMQRGVATAGQVDVDLVDHAVNQVGDPREVHREYAVKLLASLPEEILTSVREPYGARAVVYCLLLDAHREVRQRQVAALRANADPAVLQLASQLQQPIADLDPRTRLPLIDLALPALRSLSPVQFEAFDRCVHSLVAADETLALFEWTLGRIIARHL
ncbi:MAG: M48 family metallopeptidase, partial [Aeoliella sp.]